VKEKTVGRQLLFDYELFFLILNSWIIYGIIIAASHSIIPTKRTMKPCSNLNQYSPFMSIHFME